VNPTEWTVTGGAAAIIAALGAVIKMFWNKQEAETKDLKQEVIVLRGHVDECRDDRENLRIELAQMNARIDKIEKKA
jgi:methylthioribose-1-phosphate isomerase